MTSSKPIEEGVSGGIYMFFMRFRHEPTVFEVFPAPSLQKSGIFTYRQQQKEKCRGLFKTSPRAYLYLHVV